MLRENAVPDLKNMSIFTVVLQIMPIKRVYIMSIFYGDCVKVAERNRIQHRSEDASKNGKDADNKNYKTKNDRAALKSNVKLNDSELAKENYGELKGHYRHKGNVNSGIESDNGRVTAEQAEEAVKRVKFIGPRNENE